MIEDYVGLHESIEIIYVVDGYEAKLYRYAYMHGDVLVAQGWGSTIEEALGSLEATAADAKARTAMK